MKYTHTAIVSYPDWIIKAFESDKNLNKIDMHITRRTWWIERFDIAYQGKRIFVYLQSDDIYEEGSSSYRASWLRDIQEITPEQAVTRLNVAMETLKQIAGYSKKFPEPQNAQNLAIATVRFIEDCL